MLVLASIWAVEEDEETIDITRLLEDEDLLDALILGDDAVDDSVSSDSIPSPAIEPSKEEPEPLTVPDDESDESTDDVAETSPKSSSLWHLETTIALGAGYKENVLFSAFDAQDSAFTTAELEAILFRTASPDQWQFFAYLLAENAHYFDVDGLDDEWLALALFQAHRTRGSWKFGLGGQYIFLEQAFSLTFEDLDLGSSKITLNHFSIKPSIEYSLLGQGYLRLDLPVETNRFADQRQNYHEYGIHLAGGKRFERGGKAEAVYSFELRDYEEREIRGETGFTRAGTSLEWEDHRFELSLDFYLDAAKRWRSKSRVRLRRVVDNGIGYDDFWMYWAQQKLSYERPNWEVSLAATYHHYDYDTQTIEIGNTNNRQRSYFSIGCELEKKLAEDWAVSLGYQFEDYSSNIVDDVYNVSVISLALSRTF